MGKKGRILPPTSPEFEQLEPRLLLSVSPATLDITPSSLSAPLISAVADESHLEGGDSTAVNSATPTGNKYMLFDDWGGGFVDAEKAPPGDPDGNPPGTGDDYMCWAAAASNILEWTGWGLVDGMQNADQMFDHIEWHWTDDGGYSEYAWQWWFETGDPSSGGAYVDVGGGGYFYPTWVFENYFYEEESDSGAMSAIDEFLHDGRGVTLGLDTTDSGHVVTCWGYNYNPSNPSDYYGVWITDSDNDKDLVSPPDVMEYFPVTEVDGKWILQGYAGPDDYYIGRVDALAWNSWPFFPFTGPKLLQDVYVNQHGDASVEGNSLNDDYTDVHRYNLWFDRNGDATFGSRGGTDTMLGYYPHPGRPQERDKDSGIGWSAEISAFVVSWAALGLAVRPQSTFGGEYRLVVDGPEASSEAITLDADKTGTTSGIINGINDYDFYHFTANETGNWWVTVTPTDDLDPVILAFDASGEPLFCDFTEPHNTHGSGSYETWLGPGLTAGETYYIRVDGYGSSIGGFDVEVHGPPPDLLGTYFEANPSKVGGDGQVTIDFEVTNDGPGSAGSSTVAFYLSPGDDIWTDDIPLGTASVGPLAGGASYSGQAVVNLPVPDPFVVFNRYWIGMIVDPDHSILELLESNNHNRGAGLDMDDVSSEQHLPSPEDQATVLAESVSVGQTVHTDLGGDEWIGAYDIDIYTFTPTVGQRVAFDIDRTSGSLDSYVRLYEWNWDILAENDNAARPGELLGNDSYLEYTFYDTPTCYLVVTAVGNHTSDPRRMYGRSAATTGQYDLTIEIAPPNLSGAYFTVEPDRPVPPDGQVTVAFTVLNTGGPCGPFDIAFYLSDNDHIWDVVDTLIDTHPVSGINQESLYSNVLTLDLGSVDPLMTDNEYWLGMIIDPNGAVGDPKSNYGDGLDKAEISSELHLPVPADGTSVAATAAIIGGTVAGNIGEDEWVGACDLDTYSVSAAAGQTLSFDIDLTSGNLNSYIRLYDPSWTLLASNDDGTAPGESWDWDSYLQYTFATGGTCFLVVSDSQNNTGDPRLLTGRTTGDTGGYELSIMPITVDLVGTYFDLDPRGPLPANGQTTASLRILNQGIDPAGPFNVGIYLSDDEFIWTNDTLLATVAVPGLPAGLEYSGTVPLTLPVPDPFRTDNQYWVGMVIDSTWAVVEWDEQNNQNQGLLLDMADVASEAHLPSPADGVSVIATQAEIGVTLAASIGNDEWIGPHDIDTYSFTVWAGQTLAFDIDTIGGPLDSMIELFDSSWTLLAANNDAGAPGEAPGLDSYLEHTFASAGTYYLAVSGYTNGGDPRELGPLRFAASTGDYELTANWLPPDLTGTAFDAHPDAPVPADGHTTVDFSITNQGEGTAGASVVAFYLSDDETIEPTDTPLGTLAVGGLNAAQVYSDTIELDLPDPDPFRDDNEYFVGMIIDANGDVTESNEVNNANVGAGQDLDDLGSEAHLPSPLDSVSVIATPITVGVPIQASIGLDEWIGPYDIDVYSVTAQAGKTLGFDIDLISGILDSYIRLYDSSWQLLGANNDAAAPGEQVQYDSYLAHSFTGAGAYYLVVSSYLNQSVDPRVLSGRVSFGMGEYSLIVEEVLPDMQGESFTVNLPHPVPGDGQVDVSFSISNQGNGPAGVFDVTFYLSEDAFISTSDTPIATQPVGPIATGQTYSDSILLSLGPADPFLTDNEYWLGMIVDPDGNVTEHNESNNANRGESIDSASVSSEAHLPHPASMSVTATPLAVESTVTAAIGDEWIGEYDLDTYSFTPIAGQTLSFDIDRLSGNLDSLIRLYDAGQVELDYNNDMPAPGEGFTQDSYLEYTFAYSDTFYLVVGAYQNYGDWRSLPGRSAATTGSYDLTVEALLPDLLTTECIVQGGDPVSGLGTVFVDFTVENPGLVPSGSFDLAFYLSDDSDISTGDTLITTRTYSGGLDPASSLDDWIGLSLPNVDPFQTDNQYWVGMIVDPDGNVAEADETNNANLGDGIDRGDISSEGSLPCPADGVNVATMMLSAGNPYWSVIDDEWIGPRDLDIFSFSTVAGQRLQFDLDRLTGDLDSYLRLYDSSWVLLGENDNGEAPGEPPGQDSFLEYTVGGAGTHYLVVGDAGNSGSDPRSLAGRSDAGRQGEYTITYDLLTVVVGRHVFYNASVWDGYDAAANAADDAAIAPDKSALLPGQTANFANYTNYSRGINGIMVDIDQLAGTPMANDFTFKVGNSDDPLTWQDAPATQGVTVRQGAGVGGSDRITIVWDDNAIERQWLQVTVLAGPATGLDQDDVFYYGNAVGETGNSVTDAIVSPADEIAIRNNPHTLGNNPADIDDPYDLNRDRKVGPTDQVICRNNGTNSETALKLITVPVPPEPVGASTQWPLDDGVVDASDIDDLYTAISAGGYEQRLDLDNNVILDQRDVDYLVRDMLGTEYGDTNLDQKIDIQDMAALAANWSSLPANAGVPKYWATGDSNGDLVVDIVDLTALSANWSFVGSVGAADDSAVITTGEAQTSSVDTDMQEAETPVGDTQSVDSPAAEPSTGPSRASYAAWLAHERRRSTTRPTSMGTRSATSLANNAYWLTSGDRDTARDAVAYPYWVSWDTYQLDLLSITPGT